MQPRNLRHETLSLEDLWYDILYTEARLSYEDNGKAFVAAATSLVDRAELVRLGQLKVWRKEVIAQAHVDSRNEALDNLTREFEKQLYRYLEDDGVREPYKDPRYKAYFPEGLSRTINLGLETQIQKTKFFVTAIRKENATSLLAFAARFIDEFAKADVAIKELRDTQVERRNHRTNEIIKLFDDVNAERQNLYGKLTSYAADQRLGREWAEKFFRHSESTADDPRDLKRKAILLTMTARQIELSKENRQRINNEDNEVTLNAWLSIAGTITEQGSLFL
jgi:hypothetical protein